MGLVRCRLRWLHPLLKSWLCCWFWLPVIVHSAPGCSGEPQMIVSLSPTWAVDWVSGSWLQSGPLPAVIFGKWTKGGDMSVSLYVCPSACQFKIFLKGEFIFWCYKYRNKCSFFLFFLTVHIHDELCAWLFASGRLLFNWRGNCIRPLQEKSALWARGRAAWQSSMWLMGCEKELLTAV